MSYSEVGIGGFKFFAVLNDNIKRESNIPDKVVEDGSILNDHINRKPKVITITGNVSDMYISNAGTNFIDDLRKGNGILNFVDPPSSLIFSNKFLDVGTTPMQNSLMSQMEEDLKYSTGLTNLIPNNFIATSGRSIIEEFLDFMEAAYEKNETMSVSTTRRTYNSMVIQNLLISRDNAWEALSFNVTFKEFVFRKLETTEDQVVKSPSKSSAPTMDPTKENGSQNVTKQETSVLTDLKQIWVGE